MESKNMESKKEEPLLQPENKRYTTFPLIYKDIWELYKTHQNSIWKAEELYSILAKDNDWEKLNKKEQHFISYILAFFAASDNLVNENLAERFLNDVQFEEAKCFYRFQLHIEAVHSEVYSLLIDKYIQDENEKNKLFDAMNEISCIKQKAQWMTKWINSGKSFAHRLLAFAFVEGIYFSSSFCTIFWFMERNLLPGLTKSNEWISRDEGLHVQFAILLYNNYIVNKISQDEIFEMITEAVDIEIEFVNGSLPYDLLNMNKRLMGKYVKFVADDMLVRLGYSRLYHVKNPFKFMEKQSIGVRLSNFFENNPTEYKPWTANSKPSDLDLENAFGDDF